jgi:hypothetical protein
VSPYPFHSPHRDNFHPKPKRSAAGLASSKLAFFGLLTFPNQPPAPLYSISSSDNNTDEALTAQPHLPMESLLSQSRAMCPFLKKTSPATLRSLSTATHHSPGGGTITNLQFIARRCPVMNKALAVQSARIRTATYTRAATGAGTAKSLLEKKLHTSAEKKASVDINVFNNRQQGMC